MNTATTTTAATETETETPTMIKAQNDSLVEEMTKEKKIPVVEIFGPTIQGEGPLAGSKTMFVRFGGCDFRCTKCDSLHAVIPQAVKKNARRMTQEEIYNELLPMMQKTGTKWVTLSGGNPAMWDLGKLQALIQQGGGYTAVETQGTLRPDWMTEASMIVISPKSPGMGEKFNRTVFKDFITKYRNRSMMALKIVVFSQQDIDFALEVGDIALEAQAIPRGMRFLSLGNPFPPVLNDAYEAEDNPGLDGFDGRQPFHRDLQKELLNEYRLLIDEMVCDHRVEDWKFLPQIHVLVYGNEAER